MNYMKGGVKFDFDCIVIGGGSAGFGAVFEVVNAGHTVALIEKGTLGGECPSVACIPSKALLQPVKALLALEKYQQLGLEIKEVKLNLRSTLERKNALSGSLTGTRLEVMLMDAGVELIRGAAEFVDSHTVKVGQKLFRAKKFILTAGTRPNIPAIPGLLDAGYFSYEEGMGLKKFPKRIAVLGGGPVGVEFATIFNGFGSEVTIIQSARQLLPREEPEIASVVEQEFRRRGVSVLNGAQVMQVSREKKITKLLVQQGRMEFEVVVDAIFLATGKASNAKALGVAAAGIKLDERGFIKVDDSLQTSVPHIYAAGDVKGGPQFTHVAAYDGEIAGHNAAHQNQLKVDYRVLPRATFCYPEVASVGLTEEEARIGKRKISVGTASYSGFGASLTGADTKGLAKIVADVKTGEILGAGIVGERAPELIHEIALAMKLKATLRDIAGMIHAYPTYSEIVKAAAASTLRYE